MLSPGIPKPLCLLDTRNAGETYSSYPTKNGQFKVRG